MKLANFEHAGLRRAGLVVGEEIVDLTAGLGAALDDAVKVLALGAPGRKAAEDCARSSAPRVPLGAAKLSAPCARPDKVFGVGMTYRSFVAAAERLGMPSPAHRPWFERPASCVVGPRDDIWLPAGATDLDYEGELAVVIGRRCREVSVSCAAQVIGGFCVANDLTLRARAARSLALGKCFDTHTPLGPWIVSCDEAGNVYDRKLRTWVNGELRQEASINDLIVRVEDLIAELSAVCTLNPGDILLTGTPAGCGIFLSPPRCLAADDVVRVEIEGLGEIENRVVCAPALEAGHLISSLDRISNAENTCRTPS